MALNYGSLSSAMQGYNPQQQQSSGNGNPLSNILGDALNVLPFVLPEIGIPARLAAGALSSAGSELLKGQPLDAGQITQGALFGMLPGGGFARGAKAGEKAAATAAEEAGAKNAADEVASMYPKPTEPTSINPETNQGHINFNADASGNPTVDTNNTFTPPAEESLQKPPVPLSTPVDNGVGQSDANNLPPATGEAATSRYTPQQFTAQPQLSPAQSMARNEAVNGMVSSMQAAGMKANNIDANNLANAALDLGYNDFPSMAKDSYTLTGADQGVDNAVNNMVKQAAVGDSAGNPTTMDVTDIATPNARQNMVDLATRGTTGANGMGSAYTDAQRKVLQNAIQDQNVALAGAGKGAYRTLSDAVQSGDLVKSPTGGYELSSEALKNINPVDLLQVQKNFAQKAAEAKTVGEQELFQQLSNNLRDKLGNVSITKEGAQNVLDNLEESGFADSNPTQYKNLQDALNNGTISNISQLRSFTAPWVKANQAYAKATGGASIYDLAAGGRSGISKGLLSSGKAAQLRVKAARAASNMLAKPGSPTAFGAGNSGILGKVNGMSPLAKAATLAGILGIGGIGANAVASSGQNQQAQALLNDPTYQKTQELLNNSNGLQRYLGEQGEIRSIFAPTFDTNAGQAGSTGQAMLTSANTNEAARQAAENLLRSRANMGQGGILGSILSLIPGTSQNAYAQQAANAQAQLNALGIPGSAPGVSGNTSTIPSLTSMSGAVGGF